MSQTSEEEGFTKTANDMRLQTEKRPQLTLLGKDFTVFPEVFNPDIFPNESEVINQMFMKILEEEIAKTSGTLDFLEMGCGAGYTSVLTALASKKCRVWATDINEAAVANTKENSKLHGVEDRVKAVVADVFDSKEIIGRKFDMIYWDPPWFSGQCTDHEAIPLLKSLVDPGYLAIRRFLSDADKFLKATGTLLFAFSFILGSEPLLKTIASETGWRFEVRSTSENLSVQIPDTTQYEVNVIILEFHKENN